MAFLNLAAVRVCTEAEGPGKRFAIWCQGCENRCEGCCNKHMQVIEVRHIIAVEDLMNMIVKAKFEHEIEGISIIGGEPLLQAGGVAALAVSCQDKGLSVLVFTGFLYGSLENKILTGDSAIKALLDNTDILVDGSFRIDEYDEQRDWVGSKNQRVWFLSNRYKNGIEFHAGQRTMEIRISADDIGINGWPF